MTQVTDRMRWAYELARYPEKFPSQPTKQDVMRARTALVLYDRDRRSMAAQKGAQTRRDNRLAGVRDERTEQLELARWLDARHLIWIHVPNEGRRSKRHGADLRDQGMRRRFPDVVAFSSLPDPPAGVQPRGVAIELKRADGGTVSDDQQQWLADLAQCGWLCRVCHGASEAIAWLEELGW